MAKEEPNETIKRLELEEDEELELEGFTGKISGHNNEGLHWYQYAVKVVCGYSEPEGPVAPGHYYTAVNVHNPDNCRLIKFRWKVTVAFPGRSGPVSRFVDAELGPDQSLEIDCSEICKLAEVDSRLLKGFVVLQSPEKLDVVAVYTAAKGRGDEPVQTMHVERVESSHQFHPCRPLALTLDTGVADWKVRKLDNPGQHGYRDVVVVADPSIWSTAPTTATWVADSADASSPGTYVYLFVFRLSSCFKSGKLMLDEIWADNEIVDVRLNIEAILPSGDLLNNFQTGRIPASSCTTTGFKAGANVLRITVRNDPIGQGHPTPTGISIHGRIFVEDGVCD